MKRYAALLLPTLLAGCYDYAPGQAAALRPGAGVRARVSPTAAARIEPLLGTSDARILTGTLVENSSGTLIIEVPTAAQAGVGSSLQNLYQRVSIGPGELVELESRRLDRTRTGLVVGAAAVVAASVAVGALHGSPGSDRPPTGSSTDSKRLVWRLHF